MPQAMKIPAAKAAVDKEWEKLEKIPARDLTKVRSKSEVIDEARTKGIKVHFASLLDICHLKNAELETKHQKYIGRVVLRGDIVLSWYKIFLVCGFSLIRVKRSLQMRRGKVCQNSWSRRTDRKLYIPTTRWNLGKHVKIYHGITVLQHVIDPRQMASLKEPFDEKKKVQQYCYNQNWMKDGGLIL